MGGSFHEVLLDHQSSSTGSLSPGQRAAATGVAFAPGSLIYGKWAMESVELSIIDFSWLNSWLDTGYH